MEGTLIEGATHPSRDLTKAAVQADAACAVDGDVPLFVDLDGTLIVTDLLVECFLQKLKSAPVAALSALLAVANGKASLKRRLANNTEIDVEQLPYHQEFLAYVRQEAVAGRAVILATSADSAVAEQVARHLGFFSDVIASDGSSNRSGESKLAAIAAWRQQGPFDYAGNAAVDLPIWRRARRAIVVNASASVERQARCVTSVDRVFRHGTSKFRSCLRACRPHQWLKNTLLFVPLLTSHTWANPGHVAAAVLAFVAFSLVASSVYLINDMLDIHVDRRHPRKRERPIASGAVPLLHAGLLSVLLFLCGLGLAASVSALFLLLIVIYVVISQSYSLHLKTIVLVDSLCLATLYTLRVIAGAVAINVPPSFWLLAFSVFVFFSLALAKRSAELYTFQQITGDAPPGRGYRISDRAFVDRVGLSSGLLSVLVFALFINSPDVVLHYSTPQLLWTLCPLLLGWISYIWLKTERGQMHDDPVVFAISDRLSMFLVMICMVVVMLAV